MMKVDKLFLGTNGLHPEEGVTTPHLLEAQVKRAMIRSAKEVVSPLRPQQTEQNHLRQTLPPVGDRYLDHRSGNFRRFIGSDQK